MTCAPTHVRLQAWRSFWVSAVSLTRDLRQKRPAGGTVGQLSTAAGASGTPNPTTTAGTAGLSRPPAVDVGAAVGARTADNAPRHVAAAANRMLTAVAAGHDGAVPAAALQQQAAAATAAAAEGILPGHAIAPTRRQSEDMARNVNCSSNEPDPIFDKVIASSVAACHQLQQLGLMRAAADALVQISANPTREQFVASQIRLAIKQHSKGRALSTPVSTQVRLRIAQTILLVGAARNIVVVHPKLNTALSAVLELGFPLLARDQCMRTLTSRNTRLMKTVELINGGEPGKHGKPRKIKHTTRLRSDSDSGALRTMNKAMLIIPEAAWPVTASVPMWNGGKLHFNANVADMSKALLLGLAMVSGGDEPRIAWSQVDTTPEEIIIEVRSGVH